MDVAIRAIFYCAAVASFIEQGKGLDNGLVKTPPMGWLSWRRFTCQIDCTHYPTACINEKLYLDMAERLVADGYKDAGYTFVNIDDCWSAKNRSQTGQLVADPHRFPHGIQWLADTMHSKGLKLGIYEDYGTKTCAGYPGSLNHLEVDAKTFAGWQVDMLKLDGCNADPRTMDSGYPEMGKYLNETKRPIVYSCSWPDYVRAELMIEPNYPLVAKHCNLWRNFDDIALSWKSILSIVDYYNAHQDALIPVNGPGQWNDPDMIIGGNREITVEQARSQMSIWCMWSAPLLMSNDLRSIPSGHKEILLNSKVIAINQDPLGQMARLIANESGVSLYVKQVTPYDALSKQYSYAILFFNRNSAQRVQVEATLGKMGLTAKQGYSVDELWTGKTLGYLTPDSSIVWQIQPMSVAMFKASLKMQ